MNDSGPHREMAVDVPDTFIGINKTPPIYPPPPKPDPLSIPEKPMLPPRDHLTIEKDGRMVNRTAAPEIPNRKTFGGSANTKHSIGQIVEPTPAQLDNIKKFQEQLRRRREEEEKIAAQNEFLRTSVRGSEKLRALKKDSVTISSGFDNVAYFPDEDEKENINSSSSTSSSNGTTDLGYSDLVAALERLQKTFERNGYSNFAARISSANALLTPSVASALATKNDIVQCRPAIANKPITSKAKHLSKEVLDQLSMSKSPQAIELSNLLATYEADMLLEAYDKIGSLIDRNDQNHEFGSDVKSKIISNNLLNNNIDKNHTFGTNLGMIKNAEDQIRIIQIEKSTEPLGATIKNEGEAVVIGRIVKGSAAEKSGLLHEGDEILEVNGIEMKGRSVNDVCGLLNAMTGTLTFLVVPAYLPTQQIVHDTPVLHVRAHFDYDPEEDLYIPCRELGISFQKGDVLHVISRDDPNWWQAYREGEEDQTLAGLIPSQSFQHQRESIKLSMAGDLGKSHNSNKGGATLLCARKGRKKKKKTYSEHGYPLYASTTTEDVDPEEILTYEEVALYYPRSSHKRPIVLIGPPNIGRHELRQRLMADSERFAAAVPHTSRPQRDGELAGVDYHFISRQQFEADILARKFVEHGEYEKAYYGTSLDAIREVVSSGKICVLNLHPQSLKLLRQSDLKPYTVFVAPPSLERLRQKKIRSGEPYKEDELKEIIATARDMEARWGHLFDMIILNNDTERAYHQLLAEINSLEREPQWVPVSWLHN